MRGSGVLCKRCSLGKALYRLFNDDLVCKKCYSELHKFGGKLNG